MAITNSSRQSQQNFSPFGHYFMGKSSKASSGSKDVHSVSPKKKGPATKSSLTNLSNLSLLSVNQSNAAGPSSAPPVDPQKSKMRRFSLHVKSLSHSDERRPSEPTKSKLNSDLSSGSSTSSTISPPKTAPSTISTSTSPPSSPSNKNELDIVTRKLRGFKNLRSLGSALDYRSTNRLVSASMRQQIERRAIKSASDRHYSNRLGRVKSDDTHSDSDDDFEFDKYDSSKFIRI